MSERGLRLGLRSTRVGVGSRRGSSAATHSAFWRATSLATRFLTTLLQARCYLGHFCPDRYSWVQFLQYAVAHGGQSSMKSYRSG